MIDPESLRTALLLAFIAAVAPIELGIATLMRLVRESAQEHED